MKKFIDYFNSVLVLLMFLTIFIQIFARLIIRVPTSWTVEAGSITYIFVVFIGISSLTRTNTHLRVDIVYEYLPKTIKKAVVLLSNLMILVFLVMFSVGAYRNVLSNWEVRLPTIAFLRWGYVYLVVLIATVMNMVFLVLSTVTKMKKELQ